MRICKKCGNVNIVIEGHEYIICSHCGKKEKVIKTDFSSVPLTLDSNPTVPIDKIEKAINRDFSAIQLTLNSNPTKKIATETSHSKEQDITKTLKKLNSSKTSDIIKPQIQILKEHEGYSRNFIEKAWGFLKKCIVFLMKKEDKPLQPAEYILLFLGVFATLIVNLKILLYCLYLNFNFYIALTIAFIITLPAWMFLMKYNRTVL